MIDGDRAALLAACAADPDDDAPRLVWADAIGGERGELVVVQCAVERADVARRERAALRRRERALLGAHANAWAELDGIATRVRFRRGFVAAIELTAARLRAIGTRLREVAPLVRAIAVTDVRVDDLREIVALARELACDGLDIVDVIPGPPWGDAFDAIAELPLRSLGLPGIYDSPLELEGTPLAARLEALRLRTIPDDGLLDLSVLPRLVALSTVALPNEAVPSLRALEIDIFEDFDRVLGLVAATPRLERLAVTEARGTRDEALAAIAAIASAPSLAELDLSRCELLRDPEVARALAAARWPALRALRLGADVARGELASIIRALGPQLDVLDVRRAPPIADDVLAACDGDVIVDDAEEPELDPFAPVDWRTAAANRAVGRPCWIVHLVELHAGVVRELHEVGRARLGRSTMLALTIADSSIARHHAELVWRGDELLVRDLGSTNGTFVDGIRCDHVGQVVPDGAQLLFGGHLARVFHGDGGGARARAAALALADRDPWTWLPRAAPAGAARVRFANEEELRQRLGWIVAARARREVAVRLAASGAAVFAPSDDEFAIEPAGAAAQAIAAATASPLDLDGELVALALHRL